MEKEIIEFKKIKEDFVKKLQAYVIDKNIPLEKRWDAFLHAGIGEHYDSIVHFKTISRMDYLIDPRRYQIITVNFIIDMCRDLDEELICPIFNIDEKQCDTDFEELLTMYINKFKEEVLEKFIYSFEFDW